NKEIRAKFYERANYFFNASTQIIFPEEFETFDGIVLCELTKQGLLDQEMRVLFLKRFVKAMQQHNTKCVQLLERILQDVEPNCDVDSVSSKWIEILSIDK